MAWSSFAHLPNNEEEYLKILAHLKNNMNDYLGRDKTEKKKESVIGKIKDFKVEEKSKPTEKKKASKEAER